MLTLHPDLLHIHLTRQSYVEDVRAPEDYTGCLERKKPIRSEFSAGSMEQVLYTSTPPDFTNLHRTILRSVNAKLFIIHD